MRRRATPDDVVKKLNDAMVAAMNTPAVHDRLQGLGAMIVTKERSTPAYLGKFTADEIKKWAVADQGKRRLDRVIVIA